MNENGGDNASRAATALRRFLRAQWEDRDATLFLTRNKSAPSSRTIQSGPVVPPSQRGGGFAPSPVPVAPRAWTNPAPQGQGGPAPAMAAAPRPPSYGAKPAPEGRGLAGPRPGGPDTSQSTNERHDSGIINPTSTARGRTLLKHWEEIKNCQLCPLGKTRTKFVYGMGRADTKLVFIGEAPGQQEDQSGLPFVGASGKMLDGILGSLGMSRDSYFICNVLKCRPPENRNPLPDEIEKCGPYLEKQMKILSPKYVVALGTFAAQSLLKTIKPIGQLRGKWHQLPDFEVLPVYHPAAACRSTANKKVLEEDLKFLKKRLDGDRAKPTA